MEDLKPCPFCGSTKLKVEGKRGAKIRNDISDYLVKTTYSVRCNVCYARGGAAGAWVPSSRTAYESAKKQDMFTPVMRDHEIISIAVERWNKRAIEAWNTRQ